MTNYFKTLNEINVNDKVEKKNNITYLSWAYCWGEVKKIHPDATYTVYENADGWNYFTDGKTCWVKTGVTVNSIEHIEYLPVMDYKNKSIPLDVVTSFDVNKTIQRSLTKACARHGLGLYIYAGEDLPEGEEAPKKERTEFEKDASKEKAQHTRIMNKAVAAQDESLVKPVEQKKPLAERIVNAKKFLDEQTPETIAQVKRSTIDSMRALIAELKEKDFLSDADILEAKFNALIGLDDEIPY
jgi:hypothetical protein